MTTIFLAEDHQIVRAGLRALLERAQHTIVGEGETVTECLSEIARLSPRLLLLDLQLGGQSGFELLAELQRRRETAAVIVLSGSYHPQDVARALRMGVSGYVHKGALSTELLTAVDTVTLGRRYLGQEMTAVAVQALGRASDGIDSLSPRELQTLVMVARGKTSLAIGKELNLSSKTVDTYRSRLMSKLELPDIPALVRWAIRGDLIGLDDEDDASLVHARGEIEQTGAR